jgi:predicted ATP-binding protein involved in virulence
MRIAKLELKQVACFDHLSIEFREGVDPNKADIHLLVGANGTGKSTILMALAQFFTRNIRTGVDRRLVDRESIAILTTRDSEIHAVSRRKKDSSLSLQNGSLVKKHVSIGRAALFTNAQTLRNYVDHCLSPIRHSEFDFSFAAFGYSGLRSTQSFSLTAIQEQNDNPLATALQFDKSASQDLIQWIANTKAKEAFARNRGDTEKADLRKEAVERIERIISDIIEQRFSFMLNEEPLGVAVAVDGQPLDIELLPDGLKSILSWVADLLMRLDRTPWENDVPVLERPFLLFLDEIEVHLHPAWQRKILPAVQELFPNAQVFVSTHSPFVIASADDAWIYPLVRTGRYGKLETTLASMKGNSYATILRDALGIDAAFSAQVESLLDSFYQARDNALRGDQYALKKMENLGDQLMELSEEVGAVVIPEIRQTQHRLANANRGNAK